MKNKNNKTNTNGSDIEMTDDNKENFGEDSASASTDVKPKSVYQHVGITSTFVCEYLHEIHSNISSTHVNKCGNFFEQG